MPSIKDAVERNTVRIAHGGETGTGIGPAQSFPVAPTPQQDLPMPGPQRGTLPLEIVNPADVNDSSRIFRGAGTRSSVYPPTSASAVSEKITNITNISQTTQATVAAPTTNPVTPPPAPTPGAILLETNGIPNITQDELNLASVAPVNLAPDATGDVVISVPVMVGDSGSGGVSGLVPAPGAGSAAAGEFLKADGTYAIPPGTGGAAHYQQIESAGTPLATEPTLNFLNAVIADNPGNTSTDVTIAGIAAFINQYLAAPVSLTSNTLAQVDSVLVTMPAKGGPWYVRVNYFYAKLNGGNYVSFAADSSGNRFAGDQGSQVNGNNGPAASGLSPVTYANGAAVTFSVSCIDNNNSTIVTNVTSEGGNPTPFVSLRSYLQIEVISAG